MTNSDALNNNHALAKVPRGPVSRSDVISRVFNFSTVAHTWHAGALQGMGRDIAGVLQCAVRHWPRTHSTPRAQFRWEKHPEQRHKKRRVSLMLIHENAREKR